MLPYYRIHIGERATLLQFEVSRAETFDQGNTWDFQPITNSSSHLNVRPVFPYGYQGLDDHVLWMDGDYTHYTDYHTAIRFLAPDH